MYGDHRLPAIWSSPSGLPWRTRQSTPSKKCKERDATYAKPIKVRVRLLNKETGEIKEARDLHGRFRYY